jgi:hypothetical protein
MTELNIIPECYVDTKVAEIVGQTSKKYNHQHGCGDVARYLKNNLINAISLGIVDEDKNKGIIPKYFFEFATINEENNLILKKHKDRKHYLIFICPEIEEWLKENADSVNVDPVNFNLPLNMRGFKQITKRQNIDNNIDFYRFIKELIKQEAPGLITLKKWIEMFNRDQLFFKI